MENSKQIGGFSESYQMAFLQAQKVPEFSSGGLVPPIHDLPTCGTLTDNKAKVNKDNQLAIGVLVFAIIIVLVITKKNSNQPVQIIPLIKNNDAIISDLDDNNISVNQQNQEVFHPIIYASNNSLHSS